MSNCPAQMNEWYEDATEGDLSGGEVTGGRAAISSLGLHDAAMEYFRLAVNTGGNTRLTKGDARKLMCAFQQDTTV